jgi:hypothetical protein
VFTAAAEAMHGRLMRREGPGAWQSHHRLHLFFL